MSKITVVARIVAKQDFVEALKAELIKLIIPSRAEQGCISYNLHQDNLNPSVFVFYETWEDTSAIEKHINTDHYKNYAAAVANLIEEKVVNKMTLIA